MNAASHAEIYGRARRLANRAIWTAALQRRRLRSQESEDAEFLFRKWTDFEFLIVALSRLRRAGVLATKVPAIMSDIRAALKDFDATLPMLKNMRDVAEHFDDYAMDKGRLANVSRRSLEVGAVSDTTFEWLDDELNVDVALEAGERLFAAIQRCGAEIAGLTS